MARRMAHFILPLLLLFFWSTPAHTEPDEIFLLLRLEGTITQGMSHYLKQGILEAQEEDLAGIIVVLDTPGGLVDATLDMIRVILNSPKPVITYVHPSGGIAASAGTFILLAGHVAAMTPGTTCGAAMPVALQPGQEGAETADEKTIRFLAGHLRSIAQERNRPEDRVEAFVTENLTISAQKALEEGVIDLLAYDLPELLTLLHQRSISLPQGEITLSTDRAVIKERRMTLQEQLAHVISNPQLTLLLFILGLYGIIFGLNMPGTYLPETLGLFALILALFGLGMFAINVVGILLLILAVVFYVAEVFTPTFGLLTVMGTTSLVLGAFFLPVEPMLPSEWYRHFQLTVIGMGLVTTLFFLLVISRLVKLRKVEPAHKTHGMVGYEGVVVEPLTPEGLVKIRGELWQAQEKEKNSIPQGQRVKVQGKEGMVLLVKKLEEK